ncbi:MAG TPA: PHB depolymerase family esterase, partial [Woeseiaceae bacterium]|nr:PHB depolymerase family esterase [Woeseiaceae bacterium]
MRRAILLLVSAACLSACSSPEPPARPDGPKFKLDRSRMSVSGISSGAYMAGQLHVAHSATFNGAALLAGGPYYCAEGSLQKGLGPCIKGGDTGLDALLSYAVEMADAGQVDALHNLADDKVWLFHGRQDAAVSEEVVTAARALYERIANGIETQFVVDVDVTHGMPTIDKGVPCGELKAPFLNACGYDAAGTLLAALHGPLEERGQASGELRQVDQPHYDEATMLPKAYLYVPASCAAGEACGLHVAFHGCQQSAEFTGDAFARDAGYNEWAESNRLLVLYPQVASSKLAPMNPLGCWDWWGYTGANYATRSAAQIGSVMATIDAISTSS